MTEVGDNVDKLIQAEKEKGEENDSPKYLGCFVGIGPAPKSLLSQCFCRDLHSEETKRTESFGDKLNHFMSIPDKYTILLQNSRSETKKELEHGRDVTDEVFFAFFQAQLVSAPSGTMGFLDSYEIEARAFAAVLESIPLTIKHNIRTLCLHFFTEKRDRMLAAREIEHRWVMDVHEAVKFHIAMMREVTIPACEKFLPSRIAVDDEFDVVKTLDAGSSKYSLVRRMTVDE